VSGWFIKVDIDLAGLCKRLDERCICTFEATEEGPRSPMLDQVVAYLHGSMAQLLQDPIAKSLSPEQQRSLLKERANFHHRCNLLKSFALLSLQEINDNTLLISDAFEQWIIASVKKENSVASQVIRILEAEVKSDAAYLDNVKVQSSDLAQSISRVQLDEGLPQYLQAYQPPKNLDATRLSIDALATLFN
jgi:hypothetical protein